MLKLIRTFWSYSIWRLSCHNGCFRNNLAHDSDCRFVSLCFHFTFTFICFTFLTSYQNILDRFHFHLILALILRVFSFTGCVTFSQLGRMVMFNFINKTRDLIAIMFLTLCDLRKRLGQEKRAIRAFSTARSHFVIIPSIGLTVLIVCLQLFSFYVGALPSFQQINAMFLALNLPEEYTAFHTYIRLIQKIVENYCALCEPASLVLDQFL